MSENKVKIVIYIYVFYTSLNVCTILFIFFYERNLSTVKMYLQRFLSMLRCGWRDGGDIELFGDFYWILIGLLFNFRIQTFQLLFVIYRMGNMCIIISDVYQFIGHCLIPLDPSVRADIWMIISPTTNRYPSFQQLLQVFFFLII